MMWSSIIPKWILEKLHGKHKTMHWSNMLGSTEEQYNLLTNNIAASILIHDANGNLIFCSPYTEVITGYGIDDVLSSNEDFLLRLTIEEDRERYKRAREICALGEDMLVRYQIKHFTGIPMWLETRMVPVFNKNNELTSVMSVTIDVTDSLNYQRQIEEQNRDLSDFAYMVSHDLKAPIFTIKGIVSALEEDYGHIIPPEGKGLINYITDATQRLERLVESIIEYSSISTKNLKHSDVDLNESITSVIADLGEQIRTSNARITVEPSLGLVNGSPVRIYQVFSNLIGNAIKYRSPERDPEITIKRSTSPIAQISIDIKDNGLGIPADKLDEVFRPYRRVHAVKVEGSGIGLACVKKIIDRLGGTVSVKSEDGKGSTFSLHFLNPNPKPRQIPKSLARLFEEKVNSD